MPLTDRTQFWGIPPYYPRKTKKGKKLHSLLSLRREMKTCQGEETLKVNRWVHSQVDHHNTEVNRWVHCVHTTCVYIGQGNGLADWGSLRFGEWGSSPPSVIHNTHT